MGEAAKILPAHRGAGHIDSSTIWRWVRVGTPGPDGQTVKLEAARLGGRWLTTRAAITRFMSALTPTSDGVPAPEEQRAPSERRKATERAAKRLKAAGA
jgi:hypothetical protein